MPNYYTQTEDCPSGFLKYILHKSTETENVYRQSCRKCGFLWLKSCCENIFDGTGLRTLTFYGCNSNNKQLKSSGGLLQIASSYVYGGSFTQKKVNPVTGIPECPNESFGKVPVKNTDIHVCLAERVADTENLSHYGGIYLCNQGNVAIQSNKKECSTGYSAYVMGAIEGDCLLFICLKFEIFPEVRQLPSIVLPPFFSIPPRNEGRVTINLTNFDEMNQITTTPSAPKSHNFTLQLSITGGLIGLIAAIIIAFLLIKNKRR